MDENSARDESATELFDEFLENLMSGEPVSFSSSELPPWFEEGCIYEVSDEIYLAHLQGEDRGWTNDSIFVSAKEPSPVTLFWANKDKFFAKKLSIDQTIRFRLLANLSFYE